MLPAPPRRTCAACGSSGVAEQIWTKHNGRGPLPLGLFPDSWVCYRLRDGKTGHERAGKLHWDWAMPEWDRGACVVEYFRMPEPRPVARQYRDKPIPTGVEAEVCELIARRQQAGIAKYGQTVADNPLSLRQWLQHALEETLDKAVYLKRAINEIDARADDCR